jgi:hypothetical protein
MSVHCKLPGREVFRGANHLSRGFLPSVVCFSVIDNEGALA